MTPEARFFWMNMAVLVFGLAAVLGVCGVAILKGGRPERYGSIAYVAAWLTVVIFEVVVGQSFPVVPILLLDTLVALAFLVLALLYNNLWLGTAMILQGISLGAHASNLTSAAAAPTVFGMNLYAILLNATSFGILITLGCATGFTLSQRTRARRSRLSAEPPSAAAPATSA